MPEVDQSSTPRSLMRLQSWLSPAFPAGSYAYSHGLEWAVEAGRAHDRASLVDWLGADLRFGSGRNEAIFFTQALRCARAEDLSGLIEIAELAAAFRGTRELSLEASQPAAASLATLRRVWPDGMLERLAEMLREAAILPTSAIVLGVRAAGEQTPAANAAAVFLQSYAANLVNAGVRLIPLGQTDGQLAIAELDDAVLDLSVQATESSIGDLGSVAFMVDLASAAHETQYTRLFRS